MPGIDPPPASTYNKEAPAAGQTIVVKEGEEPPAAPEGLCWKEGDYDRQWVLMDLELTSAEKKELQEQLRDLQTQLEEKEKQEKDKGDASLAEKPNPRPFQLPFPKPIGGGVGFRPIRLTPKKAAGAMRSQNFGGMKAPPGERNPSWVVGRSPLRSGALPKSASRSVIRPLPSPPERGEPKGAEVKGDRSRKEKSPDAERRSSRKERKDRRRSQSGRRGGGAATRRSRTPSIDTVRSSRRTSSDGGSSHKKVLPGAGYLPLSHVKGTVQDELLPSKKNKKGAKDGGGQQRASKGERDQPEGELQGAAPDAGVMAPGGADIGDDERRDLIAPMMNDKSQMMMNVKSQMMMKRSEIATALRTPPALMANDVTAPSAFVPGIPASFVPRPPPAGLQMPPPPALPQLPNVDTSSPAPMPASLFSMLMRLEAAQVRLEAKVDLILDNQLQLLDLQMEGTTNPAT